MLMFNIKEWNYIITKTSDLNTSHVNVQYLCDSLKGLTSINLNTSHVNVQWK